MALRTQTTSMGLMREHMEVKLTMSLKRMLTDEKSWWERRGEV